MRDLANAIAIALAIAPVVVTDDSGITGITIDRQNYDSVTFGILTGTLADAAFTGTITVQEGDLANMSDAASVADADLIISANVIAFNQADDAKTIKIGYVGNKRYVRVNIATTGNAGSLPISAFALLGHPTQLPQSTQKL